MAGIGSGHHEGVPRGRRTASPVPHAWGDGRGGAMGNEPTVRHATRNSCVTALFDVRTASQAARSSKSRVGLRSQALPLVELAGVENHPCDALDLIHRATFDRTSEERHSSIRRSARIADGEIALTDRTELPD